MKKILIENRLSFLLLALFCAYGAWMYPQMPETVPTHFNLHGEPDAYGDKMFGFVFLPIMNLLLLFVLPMAGRLSPEGFRGEDGTRGLARVNLALTVLFGGLYFVILRSEASPHAHSFQVGFGVVMSVFLIVMGHSLSQVPPNFVAGIRTRWSLKSERNWQVTHRFTGALFVTLGLVGFVLTLILKTILVPMVILMMAGLIPVVYSFAYHRRYER